MATTMRDVARKAGVSRQAIYMYFDDRWQLFTHVASFIEEQNGLGDWRSQVEAVTGAKARLLKLAELSARRSKLTSGLIHVLETDRLRDEKAAVAWSERQRGIIRWLADMIVAPIAAEGLMHAGWDVEDAASILAAMMSFAVWNQLADVGYDQPKYVATVTTSVLAIFGQAPAGTATG